MKRSCVRPSVRLSHHATAASACGGFAAELRAGGRYRSTSAGTAVLLHRAAARRRAANANSVTFTADVGSC